MDLKFEVTARINRPVPDVFEAVVNPEKLSAYFTTGGAKGRIEEGTTVVWDFHDFPGAFPVNVVEVEKDRRIVLEWQAEDVDKKKDEIYNSTVTMRFEPTDDGRTIVSIAEEGWRATPNGLKSSYGNCQGWTQMQCALKAYLEHGINLRDGYFK